MSGLVGGLVGHPTPAPFAIRLLARSARRRFRERRISALQSGGLFPRCPAVSRREARLLLDALFPLAQARRPGRRGYGAKPRSGLVESPHQLRRGRVPDVAICCWGRWLWPRPPPRKRTANDRFELDVRTCPRAATVEEARGGPLLWAREPRLRKPSPPILGNPHQKPRRQGRSRNDEPRRTSGTR